MEFVTASGYLFELGGCFSFEAPPVAWQRKFDIVAAAISDAMAGVRPGMSAGALVDMIRRRYERENLAITGRRLWDFHGQGMHSLMRPYGLPNSSDVVEDSTMINIHPGILTKDGLGISATNNFIVTPDGGRALGGFRHVWHVV